MIAPKRRIVKLLIFLLVFFSAGVHRAAAAEGNDVSRANPQAEKETSASSKKETAADASSSRTVQDEKTVITIEHSQATSYEKNKETGNDSIVLSGDVRISVAKGNTKTTIRAERITYDRKTQMMYASGGVSMEQTGSAAGNSTATASSLMFNTSTLEGVFDDGRIVQTQTDSINLPSGSTLIVASDMFGRSESNTVAFKNGSLTFCDDENPHWHIDATRIWLLPGGEFAFFNALLYVGVVPVLYLPAFYYPKDELIYNPVFGYDARRGYFIQTTAYLYGRKPLYVPKDTSKKKDESDDSDNLKALFNFIRPSTLKKQKLEGIVLHNLDEDYTGGTANYFKIMGDWYSNLGFLTGFEGVFKPNDYITEVTSSTQFAFSNTVFRDGAGNYTPYDASGNRRRDTSNFMGVEMPFRYGANFKFVLSKPFSFTLSLLVYSDPFITDDFSERNETMDWIGYLTSMGTDSGETKTVNEISSFSWTLASSYSLPSSVLVIPYISSLSLSLNASVVYSSVFNKSFPSESPSPERKFYYPSQLTPATASLSLSGTIFSYPEKGTNAAKKNAIEVPLIAPDELKTAKEIADEKAKAAQAAKAAEKTDGATAAQAEGNSAPDTALTRSDTAEAGSADATKGESAAQNAGAADSAKVSDGAEAKEDTKFFEKALPALTASSPAVTLIPGFEYKLSYSLKPTFTSQIAYSSTGLDKPEDFQWSRVRSSMYTLKTPLVLDSAASYGGSFFNLTNGVSYSPVIQRHPYISTDTAAGGYTQSAVNSLKVADFKASTQEIVNTNSVSVKPLYYIGMFKNTGLSYNSTIKLFRSEFLGTDADNPDWKYYGPDFTDKDSVTAHQLAFTYAMNESDAFSQSLVLSMTLPPQVDEYTGTLSLAFPFTTFSLSTGFKQKSATDTTWERKLVQQALTISLFNNTFKFTESYNYNWENYHDDALRLTLSWQGLESSYTMSYTKGYDFDTATGWKVRSKEEFLPYSLSLSYTLPKDTWYFWKNRVKIAPGLSTSVVADLLRPTNSYFLFTPSLNFEINKFLKFTFSSTSRNSVLYRYFQKMLGEAGRIPGETNMLLDLLNSYRFDDESKRKASGFKLQSLNFTLTHDLHDWDFNTTFKVAPRFVTDKGRKYYDFNPYVTISVVWRPMESMKTKIVDKYGEWELNP
ncbi:hypothetical protein [Treponema socranskii]|uniref:hypothetical protein n=1 Tax=Treponema socranskii TaxID=53419 RepID=UPI003D702293